MPVLDMAIYHRENMMTILYNCRHSGDQYRITKFDSDMNPISSYLCSLEECDCPRGPHPTCRHRQMLPKFIFRQHVGDEWFLDFDRGGWVQMGDEWIEHTMNLTAIEVDERRAQATIHGPDFTEQLDAMVEIAERVATPTHIKRRL